MRNIYYYNTEKDTNNKIKSNLIKTVKDNMGKYTKREILKANEVTYMQRYFFWPSTDSVNKYFVENQLQNYALKSEEIQARESIYGTPYQLLRSKMLRRKQSGMREVRSYQYCQ